MKTLSGTSSIADSAQQPAVTGKTQRRIENVNDNLLCHRSSVDFEQLAAPDNTTGSIRVYGGYACATLQLRGFGQVTRHGRAKQMIATATHLDKDEITALIAKLQEILPTLA